MLGKWLRKFVALDIVFDRIEKKIEGLDWVYQHQYDELVKLSHEVKEETETTDTTLNHIEARIASTELLLAELARPDISLRMDLWRMKVEKHVQRYNPGLYEGEAKTVASDLESRRMELVKNSRGL